MDSEQILRDLHYLAGSLHHRDANTEQERSAAEYVCERLKEYTLDTELDDFESIEGPWLLFASYYAEFLFVAVIATWWPWIAFAYGAVVFLLYMAEFTGYRLFARLLPRYQSQNVAARYLAPNPRCLFVVTAHYDSARHSLFRHPRLAAWLPALSNAILACMAAVLVSCALQATGAIDPTSFRYDLVLRWSAVGALLTAAAVLLYAEASSETGRGAVDNASGVVALLALAQRFRANPLEEADLWFVATGSSETWLSGMYHFLKSHRLDRTTTYFLDLDSVGAGSLRYVTAEGLMHSSRSSPEMVQVAQELAPDFDATSHRRRGLPSDGFLPRIHGYKSLGLLGVADKGPHATDPLHTPGSAPGLRPDTLVHVQISGVQQAADYAEAILRRLAGQSP